MKYISITALILFFAGIAVPVQSQWAVAPEIVIAVPQSDFENVSRTGGGFGVKVIRSFKNGLQLRGDFSFLSFGKEFNQLTDRNGTPIIDIFGFPIIAEFRNQSLRMTFGPQYTLGVADNFKVYAGVNGGFYYFRTNVTAQGSTFGFSDSRDNSAALGWNFGGGLLYDIGLGPWLDLSVQYTSIANVSSRSKIQNAQGKFDTIDITAKEITVKFGVIFFLK